MKRFTLLLYGDPGVGKSVFTLGLDKPYFITTDGNYEFLDEFGAKWEDHKQVNSYAEFKELADAKFSGYNTIVIDLLEDLFKWCEKEYVEEKKLDHISDLPWSQGYDTTRSDFFDTICKYLAKEDKSIVLVSHAITSVFKDKRGVEHTTFRPSDRIPAKLLDRIEGRLRFVLRCYLEDELVDDVVIKHRLLSFIPKAYEYGIARGIDENKVPKDIALDPKLFLQTICYKTKDTIQKVEAPKEEIKPNIVKIETPKEEPKKEQIVEQKEETKVEVETIKEKVQTIEPKDEPKKEEVVVPEKPTSEMTPAEKLAWLKARILKK